MPTPPSTASRGLTPSHYELLDLPATASPEALRRAFRTLSKRYHPDTTTLPRDQAAAAFQRLRAAYAVLSDPVARRAYDAELRRPAMPAPAPPSMRPRPVSSSPTSVRRALSGGEWFALLLLAVALVLSLVLGIGLAWARGTALVHPPSWWNEAAPVSEPASASQPAQAVEHRSVAQDASPAQPLMRCLDGVPISVPPCR
jgi:curved DNA-binding protein CbpA